MKFNAFGYAVLSDLMHNKVFKDYKAPQIDPLEVIERQAYLAKFNIPEQIPVSSALYSDDFDFPDLLGNDIIEHFDRMAKELFDLEYKLARKFCRRDLPDEPTHVNGLIAGWNRYADGTWTPCKYITEEIAVFDTETFVQGGNHAIIATAATELAWYIWLAADYALEFEEHTPELIRMGPVLRVAIGHNVGFDTARTLEAHKLTFGEQIRYIDTRSLHNITNGLTSDQLELEAKNPEAFPYKRVGSRGSLIDCYNFHCGGNLTKADKKARNVFVDSKNLTEIRQTHEQNLFYALKDITYTHEVFKVAFKKYLEYSPHRASFAGMLLLGNAILPVADDWHEWIEQCEAIWTEYQRDIETTFGRMADEIYEAWKNDEIDVINDPWLSQLDWTIDERMSRKEIKRYEVQHEGMTVIVEVPHGDKVGEVLEARFGTSKVKKTKLDSVVKFEPSSIYYGVPHWYRERIKTGEPMAIGQKTVISHLLLRLKWLDFPILKTKDKGWCYYNEVGDLCKIPHKNGPDENVGCLLSADYIEHFGTLLTTDNELASEILKKSVACSYWTSTRERVKTQRVWDIEGFNVIAPDISVHNTVTGRSGHPLWYTVPGANPKKIGTEIKTRVQAPNGCKFVSFDVDSEELIIFNLFASTKAKVIGAEPITFTALAGDKDAGTDPHSMLAKQVGIDRRPAKTINYAAQYGSGAKTIKKTLKKYNPALSDTEANNVAREVLRIKKGERIGKYFYGGSDSEAYNHMVDRSAAMHPTTPVLGRKVSEAVIPQNDVYNLCGLMLNNCFIQGAGADMLAAITTAIAWLCKYYEIEARFVVSLHDEMVWICKDGDELKLAKIMQIAHMWTWTLTHFQFGIYELPLITAYASAIYIGNVWSKDLNSTKTISNPHNDQKGREYKMHELANVKL